MFLQIVFYKKKDVAVCFAKTTLFKKDKRNVKIDTEGTSHNKILA